MKAYKIPSFKVKASKNKYEVLIDAYMQREKDIRGA